MSKKKTSENLKLAFFFLFLVGGIVFLSLIFRGVFLLKESKFDGFSHFALGLKNEKSQFISFSPKDSTIGILSLENISEQEIPADAKIDSRLGVSSGNLKPVLFSLLFDFKSQKDINFIDILRLYFYTQTVKESSIAEVKLTDKIDKREIESTISTLFVDPKIQDEKLNIEVVNATDVPGLGNKVANLVSNMGGNVILVSTGDIKKDSEIQYLEDSYTAEKISRILKIKKVKITKKSLGDVTLIIGEQYVR